MPIVADESVFNLQDAMSVARASAADVLSIYVGKGGGIGAMRKMAALAEAAGIVCTVRVQPGDGHRERGDDPRSDGDGWTSTPKPFPATSSALSTTRAHALC